MTNPFRSRWQALLPQHVLSQLAGKLADAKTPWLKNWLIRRFIRTYNVDMHDALHTEPEAYISFNDFFTRQIADGARPIDAHPNTIISPADGTIAQIGHIEDNQLLQAKQFYFDLDGLLGGDTTQANLFRHGHFATIYLAPHNYHRVHMPLNASLKHCAFIPGKLFSVNQTTSMDIPRLYSRNERLITYFDTDAGPMAVIFVGAMMVGSIQTCWMSQPVRCSHLNSNIKHPHLHLSKGDELGLFKLGSTVILLFGENRVNWSNSLEAGHAIRVGQAIGQFR